MTGAASGLGRGIAQGLVQAGAAVAFCDVDDPGAAEAAAGSPDPSRTLPVHMDVTDEGSVARAFDTLLRHWGGLDIVVCAAGVPRPTNWLTCRWINGARPWRSISPATFWWPGKRLALCARKLTAAP